jgi:hypothetical protein
MRARGWAFLPALLLSLAPQARAAGRYDDLVALFKEWRAFQRPAFRNGVPDYTPAAMEKQRRELPALQARLRAIDISGWPVPQQVDHWIVRAEMNGLDFDQRVLRPWARNPCFYAVVFTSQSDTPAREGSYQAGAIELWQYALPLTAERLAELRARFQAIPALLAQARSNLVEDARDLWFLGIKVKQGESAELLAFEKQIAALQPELSADVRRARQAVDEFGSWLEAELPKKSKPSGVGVANYDWYLKNVQLAPYTWDDERVLHERELQRAYAQLRLEQHRNRALPSLEPIASADEYRRRFAAGVTDYMAFLRDKRVMRVSDGMDNALREREGAWVPPERRDFFTEIELRDPIVMRCHGTHWFDLLRMRQQPHASPIRRGALLYNAWDRRAEGLATAMEEMMMTAGLLDARPRSRELVLILVANRAARGLAGHFVHGGAFKLDDAVRFAHEWTPNGWLRKDGATMWAEQQLYLEQPGYGTSYLGGKHQIEKLLADRARQLGAEFTLERFFDEFHASGPIPVSLIRYEMTGLTDEIERLR